MKVATKRGDQGLTDIKEGRISKADPLIECLGQLDHCMAELVLFAQEFPKQKKEIERLVDVFSLISAMISGYSDRVDLLKLGLSHLDFLVEILENSTKDFKFIYPYTCREAARLNVIRTDIRSAERSCWRAAENKALPEEIYAYLNRASDWCYLTGCLCVTQCK